jgi:hypothetical protein
MSDEKSHPVFQPLLNQLSPFGLKSAERILEECEPWPMVWTHNRKEAVLKAMQVHTAQHTAGLVKPPIYYEEVISCLKELAMRIEHALERADDEMKNNVFGRRSQKCQQDYDNCKSVVLKAQSLLKQIEA